MATRKNDALEPLRASSLFRRGSYLLLSLVLLEVLLGGFAFTTGGLAGLSASLIALLTCFVGGLIALVIGEVLGAILAHEVAALAQCVFGMLVRAAVGLGVCAIAYGFRLTVSEQGLAYYVLVFYMVTLAVETGFAVRRFGGSPLAVSSRMN